MCKFIEVHMGGQPLLVNIGYIRAIAFDDAGKAAMDMGNTVVVTDESYERVRETIGAAQGGIPMEPSREYHT